MKPLWSAIFVLVFAAVGRAESPLQEARQRWLKGNYEEAREQYEMLLKDDKLAAAAAVGLSRALESSGEYDQAVSVIEKAIPGAPRDIGLLARHAEVLYLRGRWDEATRAVDAALAVDKDNFQARWVQAQLYRDRGEHKKADEACRWFVRTYSARSDADNEIKSPDELLIVGLAGAENARWNHLADQFTFIVTELCVDALKNDKDFWPSEQLAAELFTERHNTPEAEEALDKVLSINPSAAEALVTKGLLALREYKLKDAERHAEHALKINPKLPAALRLRADVHLVAGDTAAALKELQTAQEVNPRDERTLARVAACHELKRNKAQAEAVVKEVEKFDPKPGVYWFELGEALEERRHYDEAEKCYRKAMELSPHLPWPPNSLGMLCMRLGREKEARELLDKGFAADRSNVRVNNSRKVLHHLEGYETLRTEHFELRYDPKHDAKLAKYMATYLEAIYADLAEKFNYRPKGPILIEVFRNHQMFSGRVVALPDLHTIGACTGKMVAMASPKAEDLRKPFNWARVLRHEIVHIFNLEQTKFLVPHWLTEGLAVSNEGFGRPPSWNPLLREYHDAGKLMNLDNIDLGFIRPSGPDQWQMAYCQSLLYVEYIKEKFGPAAAGELLAAYRDGLGTADAITKACKTDKAAFEKGYREHMDKVLEGLAAGKPPKKHRSTKALKEAFEKDGDLDAGGELAVRLLESGDRKQARQLAIQVLESKKGHATASYVMSRLAKLAGDDKEERGRLEGVADKTADMRVLKALAQIYYEAEEYDKAAEMYELGRKAEPFENEWLAQLARVYARKEDKGKLVGLLEQLVPADPDELEQRLRLARLLLEEKQPEKAERYARQALEIDVDNDAARDLLVKALEQQNKDAEVKRVQELLGKK